MPFILPFYAIKAVKDNNALVSVNIHLPKGADTISKSKRNQDNNSKDNKIIIENILPALTESERLEIKEDIEQTLFHVAEKYAKKVDE